MCRWIAFGGQDLADPVQLTVGFSNGERLWGVRCSSGRSSRRLVVSQDVSALWQLHPENRRSQRLSDADLAIVSEPLGNLPGAWLRAPESTALVIEAVSREQRPFRPQPPGMTANGKRPVGREV